MTLARVRRHTQAQFLRQRSAPSGHPGKGPHTPVCVIRVGVTLPQIREARELCCFPQRGLISSAALGESQNGAQKNSGSWTPIHEQVEKRKCRKERRDWKWLVGPCRPHQCIRISQQPPSARALTVPCFSAHSFFHKEAWLNWGWLEGPRC